MSRVELGTVNHLPWFSLTPHDTRNNNTRASPAPLPARAHFGFGARPLQAWRTAQLPGSGAPTDPGVHTKATRFPLDRGLISTLHTASAHALVAAHLREARAVLAWGPPLRLFASADPSRYSLSCCDTRHPGVLAPFLKELLAFSLSWLVLHWAVRTSSPKLDPTVSHAVSDTEECVHITHALICPLPGPSLSSAVPTRFVLEQMQVAGAVHQLSRTSVTNLREGQKHLL